MMAYVDSSVLLRLALGPPDALPQWRQTDRGVSSALIATDHDGALAVAAQAHGLKVVGI
jgi:hypothetical protein